MRSITSQVAIVAMLVLLWDIRTADGLRLIPRGSDRLVELSTAGGGCDQEYIVGHQDTAFNIAKQFGMLLPELQQLNPDKDLNVLSADDVLCLYRQCHLPPSGPGGNAVVVQALVGQTCETISSENKICPESLQKLNPTVQCDTAITQASVLFVTRGYAPSCSNFHNIVDGDTSADIAQANGVSLDQLQDLNPGLSLATIYPGSKLCVAS